MLPTISGWIQTGTNTPTGAPMQIAVDNPYINKDQFVRSYEAKGLGITAQSPEYQNGELDLKLLEASAWVNRICAQWFDTQTIDETKTGFQVRPYNPQLVSNVLKNRPYSKINTIYIQVLQWFIQVDTTPSGYLQDFPDKGFYRIVPLLSTAGTGIGSPIPAAILDRQPLGVLWTNYTFGYGTPLTAFPLTKIGETKQYQADINHHLWAPSQTLSVYDATVLVDPVNYTVDYPNGMVTFIESYTVNGAVTADFTTNESLPFEIKAATRLLACHLIGQGSANPLGAKSYSILTYNVNFGDKSNVEERAIKMLEAYISKMPLVLGF